MSPWNNSSTRNSSLSSSDSIIKSWDNSFTKVPAFENVHQVPGDVDLAASMDADPVPSPMQWSLMHSYLGNMGGIKVQVIGKSNMPSWEIITSFQLANCCAGSDHDPLAEFELTEAEILDKSKADGLLKALAVLQVTWTLISIVNRWIEKLPVTQLEVVTAAFAMFAIATYAACWFKPKDITIPFRINKPVDWDSLPQHCLFRQGRRGGQSFIDRIFNPENIVPEEYSHPVRRGSKISGTYEWLNQTFRAWYRNESILRSQRISNDAVRSVESTSLMAILLAVSTLILGGLHCIAWNLDFPTVLERNLWRAAAVSSALLPAISVVIDVSSDIARNVAYTRLSSVLLNASKFVKILMGFLYPIPRLAILVLIFTSLRAVPSAVYDDSWTKFLPSLS
jgi:hypothetical protein